MFGAVAPPPSPVVVDELLFNAVDQLVMIYKVFTTHCIAVTYIKIDISAADHSRYRYYTAEMKTGISQTLYSSPKSFAEISLMEKANTAAKICSTCRDCTNRKIVSSVL